MSLLDKICQAFINMIRRREKRVLVWENASPTSSFTKQSLNIDFSDLTPGRDMVAIEAAINNAADSGTATFIGTFINGKRGLRLSFNYGSSSRIFGYYRSVAFTSNKKLTINNGYTASTTQDTQDDEKCIPLRIFKIFGGAQVKAYFRSVQKFTGRCCACLAS